MCVDKEASIETCLRRIRHILKIVQTTYINITSPASLCASIPVWALHRRVRPIPLVDQVVEELLQRLVLRLVVGRVRCRRRERRGRRCTPAEGKGRGRRGHGEVRGGHARAGAAGPGLARVARGSDAHGERVRRGAGRGGRGALHLGQRALDVGEGEGAAAHRADDARGCCLVRVAERAAGVAVRVLRVLVVVLREEDLFWSWIVERGQRGWLGNEGACQRGGGECERRFMLTLRL